jgi:hypothetical protein
MQSLLLYNTSVVRISTVEPPENGSGKDGASDMLLFPPDNRAARVEGPCGDTGHRRSSRVPLNTIDLRSIRECR